MKAALIVLVLLVSTSAFAQPVPNNERRPGIAVDATGGQVIDPTKNVLDLVAAAIARQDDLRKAQSELFEAKTEAANNINKLRSSYDKELLKAAVDRLDSEAKLRAEFQAAINATEKDRVNAIRSVDVGAVAIATERANATANALAKTVQDTALVQSSQVGKAADDLRALVKTTADEQSRNLQQQFSGIQSQFLAIGTRLTALEQLGAEGVGKQKFQDPATTILMQKVDQLSQTRDSNIGGGVMLASIIGFIMMLAAVAGVAIAFSRRRGTTA
jgi:hypothetical protein